MYIEHFVKFGRLVFEMDRQTDERTQIDTLSTVLSQFDGRGAGNARRN